MYCRSKTCTQKLCRWHRQNWYTLHLICSTPPQAYFDVSCMTLEVYSELRDNDERMSTCFRWGYISSWASTTDTSRKSLVRMPEINVTHGPTLGLTESWTESFGGRNMGFDFEAFVKHRQRIFLVTVPRDQLVMRSVSWKSSRLLSTSRLLALLAYPFSIPSEFQAWS